MQAVGSQAVRAGCWEGTERSPLRPSVMPPPCGFLLPGHNHKGHPHTSYYQYGLSILALCLHQAWVHDSVVGKLLYAIEHEQHPDLSVGEWDRP